MWTMKKPITVFTKIEANSVWGMSLWVVTRVQGRHMLWEGIPEVDGGVWVVGRGNITSYFQTYVKGG